LIIYQESLHNARSKKNIKGREKFGKISPLSLVNFQATYFQKNPFSLKHSTYRENRSLPATLSRQSDNETQSNVYLNTE